MELVYVTRAVRRYWWLTTAVVLFFLALGVAAGGGRTERFEAVALVLVSPAGESSFGATSTDRFVQNQLVVFESALLAERVAETLGDEDPGGFASVTEFEQVVGTDIISVTAATGSAERARDIANAYAAGYVEVISEQVILSRAPELDSIEGELDEVDDQLDEVNSEIAQILSPFIDGPVDGPGIPDIDQIAPALATERDLLQDRFLELTQIRNDLARVQSQLQAGNQVLQLAETPTAAAGGGGTLILAASLFVGLIAGALVSVAFARYSGRVLDADEIEEALATPIAATIPRSRRVSDRSNLLADPLSGSTVPIIHELCVRAEASESTEGLTIAVIGTDDAAGATTVAAMMAAHYGSQGVEVLLADVDTGHPELSRLAGTESDGIAALFRPSATRKSSGASSEGGLSQLTIGAVETVADGVSFAGLGSEPSRISREQMEKVIDVSRRSATVVVFDAGAMLSAASSVRLSELVDVVVLAVPIKRQRSSALAVVGKQLLTSAATVLPVVTPASGRRGSR